MYVRGQRKTIFELQHKGHSNLRFSQLLREP